MHKVTPPCKNDVHKSTIIKTWGKVRLAALALNLLFAKTQTDDTTTLESAGCQQRLTITGPPPRGANKKSGGLGRQGDGSGSLDLGDRVYAGSCSSPSLWEVRKRGCRLFTCVLAVFVYLMLWKPWSCGWREKGKVRHVVCAAERDLWIRDGVLSCILWSRWIVIPICFFRLWGAHHSPIAVSIARTSALSSRYRLSSTPSSPTTERSRLCSLKDRSSTDTPQTTSSRDAWSSVIRKWIVQPRLSARVSIAVSKLWVPHIKGTPRPHLPREQRPLSSVIWQL